MKYATDDAIYALATPWAMSALAIVRTSGPSCISLASACFSRPKALLTAKHATLVYGKLIHPESGIALDEVIAAVYHKGHGFTGEEAIEFTCHGSISGIRSIMEALQLAGFRAAEPGEFTFRAFMNGRLDLTRAEAVQEIVAARSEKAQQLALKRLGGALETRLNVLKQQILEIMSTVEVQLDYAEDEIGGDVSFPFERTKALIKELGELAGTWDAGKLYGQGAKVVLAGAANAGKSSLFNLFLKEERAIVSAVPGTTRDYIEAWAELDGVPIRLYDTAGFRTAEDMIEAEGLRRTGSLLEQADIILFLLDAHEHPAGTVLSDWVGEEIAWVLDDKRVIFLWNKEDVATGVAPEGSISFSTVTGAGFNKLKDAMLEILFSFHTRGSETQLIIESERQKNGLMKAAHALQEALALSEQEVPLDIVAVELFEALNALGELTGEVTGSDILEQIFSGFCVGK